MNRLFFWALAAISVLVALPALKQRNREEAAARNVSIVVDWKEVRDLAARELSSPLYLLQALRNAGIQGVLYSPLTLKDAVRGGPDALNRRAIPLERADLAAQTMHELAQRGVRGIQGERTDEGYSLTRADSDFSNLADVEIGYDLNLLALGHDQTLDAYLRVNQDPWLRAPEAIPTNVAGLIFTTDDPPGGVAAIPLWTTFLREHPLRQLWVEFKPTRAATALAQAVPGTVIRTHTIPTAELKDLSPAQELSRWQRAVEERSCRCLLFRPAPAESWADFQARLNTLRRSLQSDGWQLARAPGNSSWSASSHRILWLRLVAAFAVAALAPLLGLWLVRPYSGWRAFAGVALVSLAGGVVAASLANVPETRLALIPFRGIKAAMLIPWLGSVFVLYSWRELNKN